MMTDMERLSVLIERGRIYEVRSLIQQLLMSGISPEQIVQDGIMPGLCEIGEAFESQRIFIPAMLLAARTVKLGCETIKAWMGDPKPTGRKVLLGVVAEDLHDIGKNLVSIAMTSVGIPVVDLGVDVFPDQFVRAVEQDESIALVGISALLTTTLAAMRETVDALRRSCAGSRIKIMVGGAPVTEAFARSIGADIYTDSAFSAAQAARALLDEMGPLDSPDA